jgi:hypothetical protein
MVSSQPAPEDYQEATIRTANDLISMASTLELAELSSLELPEIENLVQDVARVAPAGNVPGIILSGLANLQGRHIERHESRKHIGALFRGVRQSLDRAIYTTFFAGPAAVLYGYQQLLRLAGKDPASAFAEGTWQFYLEFALREDTSRHANETVGFQRTLHQQRRPLHEGDQLAAWMFATGRIIDQLPDIIANEWYERVVLKTLIEIAEAETAPQPTTYRQLRMQWERQRPFHRNPDRTEMSYPVYRRLCFEAFFRPHYDALGDRGRAQFDQHLRAATQERLTAYQRQMSWLAYLEPGAYNEERIPYELSEAKLGVISRGRYYLVPLNELSDVQQTRRIARAILADTAPYPVATLDDLLLSTPRAEQTPLRRTLSQESQEELAALRTTPVLINWDQADVGQPLAHIRRGSKRGIGDHALTIIRTDDSFVFDQSHIFFDGAWGAAIAEVLTNEASYWARMIATKRGVQKARDLPYRPRLQAKSPPAVIKSETSAENTTIQMDKIVALRLLLKQRNELVRVTVNDLFVLYRSIHALTYEPSPALLQSIEALSTNNSKQGLAAFQAAREAVDKVRQRNPSILIPVDASWYDPRERVYPTTFRNPVLDFIDHHQHTLDALRAYHEGPRHNLRPRELNFEEAQVTYLHMLAGFGELLSGYKNIALRGESMSTLSIKFLAHIPPPIQHMLNHIPGRFELLNELIKGEEVFSNIGRVTRGSSLRRFITAKDDNENKTFAWGLLTDDDNIVHLSLRDFRPHIAVLHEAGSGDLAHQITQDYLDSYASGMNRYVKELYEIMMSSQRKRTSLIKRLFG